jgi:hypothetical protein
MMPEDELPISAAATDVRPRYARINRCEVHADSDDMSDTPSHG